MAKHPDHDRYIEACDYPGKLDEGAVESPQRGAAAIGSALAEELGVAEAKAWDSLARYKFQMFGYWAAIWVHLNRIGGFKRRNPWSGLVRQARAEVDLGRDEPQGAASRASGPRARSTRSNAALRAGSVERDCNTT
jgi:hypothetical protein